MLWHRHTIEDIFCYSLTTRMVDAIFPGSSHLNFHFSSSPCQLLLLNFHFILCHSLESRSPYKIFTFLQGLPSHPSFSDFILSFVMVLSYTPHVSCLQYLQSIFYHQQIYCFLYGQMFSTMHNNLYYDRELICFFSYLKLILITK